MSRVAYVDGQYLPHRLAAVHIEDRGYQFADGVYEVIRIYNGKTFTLAEHLARLARSADAIRIALPIAIESLAANSSSESALGQFHPSNIFAPNM